MKSCNNANHRLVNEGLLNICKYSNKHGCEATAQYDISAYHLWSAIKITYHRTGRDVATIQSIWEYYLTSSKCLRCLDYSFLTQVRVVFYSQTMFCHKNNILQFINCSMETESSAFIPHSIYLLFHKMNKAKNMDNASRIFINQ